MRESSVEILFDDACASAIRYKDGEVAVAWEADCPADSIRDAFVAARGSGATNVVRTWQDPATGTQHFILA